MAKIQIVPTSFLYNCRVRIFFFFALILYATILFLKKLRLTYYPQGACTSAAFKSATDSGTFDNVSIFFLKS